MTTTLWGRHRSWKGERDSEGHRNYWIKHLVKSDFTDGPANVLRTPGLPLPGSVWFFGADLDLYAYCKPDAKLQIHQEREGDINRWWTVEQLFSTKPKPNERCSDQDFEDPLTEPDRVSGSFVKYTEEATYDYFGAPVQNSAFEPLRGPQVEFDANRPTVTIEQNVYPLGLEVFSPLIDNVNSVAMWGLPPRCVKLSNVSWERKFYGLCYYYYTRRLEFDINYYTFDRHLLDEGTKVIKGEWDYDFLSPTYGEYIVAAGVSFLNPRDYIRYKDWHGENTRAMLNGNGIPATTEAGIGDIYVPKYRQSNLNLLLSPSSILLGY